MDVAFKMIDRDQRAVRCQGYCLRESDADQQRAGETGALGHRDGIKLLIADVGAVHRFTDDRHNSAEMFAAGELRNDAAIVRVHKLRRDNIRKHLAAVAHNRRRGLVARALDSEYQSVAHPFHRTSGPRR